ncbi:MAG: hypothetical protein PUB03_06430 [bacterium]|nr:hypothetical protein [bacterium]
MKKKMGLIILIIGFLILGGVTYNLYTYKVVTTTKVFSLNKQIKTLKSNISDLEKDNDNCSTCNVTVNNDKVQLITEELNGMDVLYVTEAVKTDNYYTLKGVIYYANHYKVADDVFENYKSLTSVPDTTNPHYYYAFRFNFKDGKCVGLYTVLTGLTLENGHPY